MLFWLGVPNAAPEIKIILLDPSRERPDLESTICEDLPDNFIQAMLLAAAPQILDEHDYL